MFGLAIKVKYKVVDHIKLNKMIKDIL